MKKVMILVGLFISMGLFGQFNTNSVYFSGSTNANLGTRLTGGSFHIPFGLGLEGGYFIQNKFALGGKVSTSGELNFEGSSYANIQLGPTIRIYKPSANDLQLFLYGHGFYGRQNGFYNQLGLDAGVGYNYFLTERIALEARASYRYMYEFYEDTFSGENFGTNNHFLNFEFAISVFFPSINFFEKS